MRNLLKRIFSRKQFTIHNQGSKNSCTAHAFARMFEITLYQKMGVRVYLNADDLWEKQILYGTATEENGDTFEGVATIAEEYGIKFITSEGKTGLFLPSKGLIYDQKISEVSSKIKFENYVYIASRYFKTHFLNYVITENIYQNKYLVFLMKPNLEFYNKKQEDMRAGSGVPTDILNDHNLLKFFVKYLGFLIVVIRYLNKKVGLWIAKKSKNISVVIEKPFDVTDVSFPKDQAVSDKIEVILLINKINKETLIKFSSFLKKIFENNQDSLLPLFIANKKDEPIKFYFNREIKDWDTLK
jgi:hypothetical protein